jgi:hypothetical protein
VNGPFALVRCLALATLLSGCASSAPGATNTDAGADAASPLPACARAAKASAVPSTCNGFAELCDRRFDQVAFPMTHNAMSNADERWAAPNQRHGIARQLADGVRGLMLDTHYYDVEAGQTLDAPLPGVSPLVQAYLCHGVCQLGRRPLLEGLCDVTSFLDRNRGEVVSIIFESYVTPADTAAVLAAAGLDEYVYTHAGAWPTLREMIAKNQRLVVFTESDGGTPAWYHPAWKLIEDTPYSFAKATDFTCSAHRGSRDSPLFLLNHWVGAPLPSEKGAAEVNASGVLLARAQKCQTERGKLPNFVGVDFYDVGDLFAVVRALNGL